MTATKKQKPDPIYAAIDRHVVAYDRMKEIGKEHNRAEDQQLEKRDLAAWKTIDRKWNAALTRERAALDDVVAARATNSEAFSAKAQYLYRREWQAVCGTMGGDNATDALESIGRNAAVAVRPPYSEAYAKILTILAAIRSDVEASRAKRTKYMKSAAYKREEAERRAYARRQAKPPKKRKLTARELAAQAHVIRGVRAVLAFFEPGGDAVILRQRLPCQSRHVDS